jgi:hypothetical protein
MGTGVLLASLALAQGSFHFADKAGSMTVNAKSAVLRQAAGPVYKFTLRNSVTVEDRAQGLKMSASQVTLDAVPSKQNPKVNEIQRAVASGAVKIVKTVTTPRGGRISSLAGSKGDYTKRGSDGLINLSGPVTITNLNTASQQSLTATGAACVAIVEPGQKGRRSGLRTATLSGGVKATINQAPVGNEKGAVVVTTCNKMLLDYASTPPTLTLLGNVNMEGRGPGSFGTMRGVSKAVVTLNEDGEWTSVSTESG